MGAEGDSLRGRKVPFTQRLWQLCIAKAQLGARCSTVKQEGLVGEPAESAQTGSQPLALGLCPLLDFLPLK